MPPENGGSAPAIETEPRPCFGLQQNWIMEDGISDPEEVHKCFDCPMFDRCHQLSLMRALQQIRYEMRRSTRGIRDSLGGAHSQRPFW